MCVVVVVCNGGFVCGSGGECVMVNYYDYKYIITNICLL